MSCRCLSLVLLLLLAGSAIAGTISGQVFNEQGLPVSGVDLDFFVVATVSFQLLYCFVVLCHDRRRVVHFNVTRHPTASWTAQQIVEAFGYDDAPRFILRDRDSIYGRPFTSRIKNMGID